MIKIVYKTVLSPLLHDFFCNFSRNLGSLKKDAMHWWVKRVYLVEKVAPLFLPPSYYYYYYYKLCSHIEISEHSNCRLVPYWREFLGVSGSRTWSDLVLVLARPSLKATADQRDAAATRTTNYGQIEFSERECRLFPVKSVCQFISESQITVIIMLITNWKWIMIL